MHRHRLLIALASVTLVAAACGDDDDSGGETVPVLPTVSSATAGATATEPGSTFAPTSLPATPDSLTMPDTTVPPPTTAATTVPETTVLETTDAPETTVVEATEAPETTVVETTLVATTVAPETTVVETTEAPETTVAETTAAPETTVVETTVVETTAAPETTVVETTEAPETTVGETTVVETTQAAETTLAPETTVPASVPIADVVLLNQDGLGLVTFGDEPEAAIAAVTAVLGAPTEDTGWSDPLTISACAGTQVRRVAWGSLTLYFGDESSVAQGRQHVFAYSYGSVSNLDVEPAGLATPEGIGIGSTLEFVRAAYPAVVIEESEGDTRFFVNQALSGFATGPGGDDLVTVIIGGDSCGV